MTTTETTDSFAQVEAVWQACDYAPTARKLAPASELISSRMNDLLPVNARIVDIGAGYGDLTARLVEGGFQVTALEPASDILQAGKRLVPQARWVQATGESTTLPSNHFDAAVSSFGSMLCPPKEGVAEWARILKPGGALVMTTWDDRGFMVEMTRRMLSAAGGDPKNIPTHLQWGQGGKARQWLEPLFSDVTVEHPQLDWSFDSVEAGMDFYVNGSPVHAFMLKNMGVQGQRLLDTLQDHLASHSRDDGSVDAKASYALITARRVHSACPE